MPVLRKVYNVSAFQRRAAGFVPSNAGAC